MSNRRHLGLVAGAATLLAAAPMSAIFDQWTWFFQCLLTVGLIVGAATLARSLRAPVWAQVLAMSGTLVFMLTWLYPSDGEVLALIPTPSTFSHFGGLLTAAVDDMSSYGVPVPDRPGLLFLTVLGVGAVAIVVDLVTVSLRRPALAGLPMLAIYSVPVAIYTDSISPIPFVIGAAGFLWLLAADNVDRVRRFGRRFSGDGRDVDAWEPSPLAAAGRRLAVVGVLVAVALPLAVPDLGVGLLSSFGPGGGGDGTGRGARKGPGAVDLFAELSGQLNQSETRELLKVTTNEPEPYYLRFAVADQVDQRGFRNRAPSGRAVSRDLPPAPAARAGVTRQTFRAQVEISDAFDMPMLPVYAQLVNEPDGMDSSWFYDSNAQIVYSNRSRSVGKAYEFDYVRSRYDPAALRRAAALAGDSELRLAFTAVPQEARVSDQVRQLTRGEDTDYDKVRAIYDFFSAENEFTYSLQTERGTSGSDIVDFLENRTGFCEQYAAAMTWMVRAAGIPARVAFGFTNGTRKGNTSTLTNRNLHAWTEVYFAGFGWVPFDATPAASVAGAVDAAWAPDPNQPVEADPTAGPTAAPGADSSAAASVGPDGRLEDGADEGAGTIPTPNSTNWPWWTLGAIVLLLALLATPALRRVLVRRRRQAGGIADAPATVTAPPVPGAVRPMTVVAGAEEVARARLDAHAAWDELMDTMVDFRVPVDPTETPRATSERLVSHAVLTGPAADATRLLGRAEERARYAREPLRGGDLATGLDTVRRALADAATRGQRLAAVVMPPSVLLRWRLGLVEATTRVILATGRGRDRLGRLNPRRRVIAARAPH
jgi:transglutaminase-like putative cysteine protease